MAKIFGDGSEGSAKRAVLHKVGHHPGITREQIAEQLNVRGNLAESVFNYLKENKLLEEKENKLYLTQRGRNILTSVFTTKGAF